MDKALDKARGAASSDDSQGHSGQSNHWLVTVAGNKRKHSTARHGTAQPSPAQPNPARALSLSQTFSRRSPASAWKQLSNVAAGRHSSRVGCQLNGTHIADAQATTLRCK